MKAKAFLRRIRNPRKSPRAQSCSRLELFLGKRLSSDRYRLRVPSLDPGIAFWAECSGLGLQSTPQMTNRRDRQFKFCHNLCIHRCEAPDETPLPESNRDSPCAGAGQESVVQLLSQPSSLEGQALLWRWMPTKKGARQESKWGLTVGVRESRRVQRMSSWSSSSP